MNTFGDLILAVLVVVAIYALLRRRGGEMDGVDSPEKAIVERKNGKVVSVKCPYCGYKIYEARKTDILFVHTSSKNTRLHYANGHYLCPKCKKPLDIPEGVLQESGVSIAVKK